MRRLLPGGTMEGEMFGFRALVADDDPSVRNAVVDALDADPRFTVVAAVGDGHAAVRDAGMALADLVILDVNMPGGGVAPLRRLCCTVDPPVVVVLSATAQPTTVATLLGEGANGFLAKGIGATELCDLLDRCMAGDLVVAGVDGRAVVRALARGAAPAFRHREPAEA